MNIFPYTQIIDIAIKGILKNVFQVVPIFISQVNFLHCIMLPLLTFSNQGEEISSLKMSKCHLFADSYLTQKFNFKKEMAQYTLKKKKKKDSAFSCGNIITE